MGTGCDRLIDAVHVDARAQFLLHPHAPAAAAATEGALLVPGHLSDFNTCGTQQLAGWFVDLVVPAQVARVVVSQRLLALIDWSEFAFTHQLVEELGVVNDLDFKTALRVVAADGREAMRAGDDDLLLALLWPASKNFIEGFNIFFGKNLVEEFVARATGGISCAGLPFAENCKLHSCHVEQFSNCLSSLLRSLLERASATNPE